MGIVGPGQGAGIPQVPIGFIKGLKGKRPVVKEMGVGIPIIRAGLKTFMRTQAGQRVIVQIRNTTGIRIRTNNESDLDKLMREIQRFLREQRDIRRAFRGIARRNRRDSVAKALEMALQQQAAPRGKNAVATETLERPERDEPPESRRRKRRKQRESFSAWFERRYSKRNPARFLRIRVKVGR